MKRSYKSIFSQFLIISLFSMPMILMAGKKEEKTVNELLSVMHFDKMIEDAANTTINATLQMMKNTNPEIEIDEKALKEFYDETMNTQTLRRDAIAIYSEVFTQKELKEIASFYKSKTGQKALQKYPEVMKRTFQLAQARISQNMDKLQKILEQEAKPEEEITQDE